MAGQCERELHPGTLAHIHTGCTDKAYSIAEPFITGQSCFLTVFLLKVPEKLAPLAALLLLTVPVIN
jgi:hypothetical protein